MSDAQPIFRTMDILSRRRLQARHSQAEERLRPPMTPTLPIRPHLFSYWTEVSLLVHAARAIRLYLDFDGTLVDFRPRPNEVHMTGKTRTALRRLLRHRCVQVAVVSGRRRTTLIRLVGLAGVKYMGLYGWEERPGCHIPNSVMQRLSGLRGGLRELPGKFPGIYLEDKRFSLAIHSRGVSDEMQKVARSHAKKLLRGLRDLHILRGEHIWEVVPGQIVGKGAVIRKELKGANDATLPIYIGDDLTDEPAFAALPHGITVLVGAARPTKARFRLRSPDEVRTFLTRLEAELP